MNTNLAIAIRLLLAKKRAMLMSLAGIVFGVGLFIATQAQTAGFETFYIRTILGTDGAVRIQDRFQNRMSVMTVTTNDPGMRTTRVAVGENRRYEDGIAHPGEILRAIERFQNVAGVSPILRGNVEVDSNFRTQDARILGIDLPRHLQVSELEDQIILGSLEDFRGNPKGVVVGSRLATRLEVEPGDVVSIAYGGNRDRYRISAIFESGVEHVDKRRLFVHMPEARFILQEHFGVSLLQVSLKDNARARETAQHIEENIRHVAIAWQEREKVWLDVFQALRVSSGLTISAIILISGLGIFNTLAIIVMEKRHEIAILRSMGFTKGDISRIFLNQGLIVLVLGAILGCGFGALITWGISNIPLRIRGIFSTDHFVVYWSPWHYVVAVCAATVVVLVASYLPARKAAGLEPGSIIRGTQG
ncbi:MAG: ABC transporter permease [Opitutales bacterium]